MDGIGSGAILGVSADYHDAAAAIVVGGEIVAAAEEERFTRRKHDPAMPANAIAWCLDYAGVGPGGLSGVVFYDKPLTTYERVLVTHAKVGPRGFPTLAKAVSSWSSTKLWVRSRLDRLLAALGHDGVPVSFAEHHQSHAASAFYPSPFETAAVLTFDGVGEWATTTIAHGRGRTLELIRQLDFPDSIGLLYSAITSFCGFEVNDGEYKLMGLAPYGEPRYAEILRERVVDVARDGSIRLDQRWFDYRAGRRMTRPALAELLDGPPRSPDAPLGQREADIARSLQEVLELIVLRIARHAQELTGERTACLAGGVALNCVANERLLRDGPFDEVWIQPAAGDAGGAIGAALWDWHSLRGQPRSTSRNGSDGLSGALLGPAYRHEEIVEWLDAGAVDFQEFDDIASLCDVVAGELDAGATVGWFQGRMEFGPRALGSRSIIADPRDVAMTRRLNLAVKRREPFRPFAPAVLAERASEWFDLDGPSPYMTMTAPVARNRRVAATDDRGRSFQDRLGVVRSQIPACTHVDHSARVQTVGSDDSRPFRRLLESFEHRTGCPVLLNTSFNRKDEPIVRSPAEAVRCFAATDMDLLVLERCLIRRSGLVGSREPT
jgi:carbamoyltransferase